MGSSGGPAPVCCGLPELRFPHAGTDCVHLASLTTGGSLTCRRCVRAEVLGVFSWVLSRPKFKLYKVPVHLEGGARAPKRESDAHGLLAGAKTQPHPSWFLPLHILSRVGACPCSFYFTPFPTKPASASGRLKRGKKMVPAVGSPCSSSLMWAMFGRSSSP